MSALRMWLRELAMAENRRLWDEIYSLGLDASRAPFLRVGPRLGWPEEEGPKDYVFRYAYVDWLKREKLLARYAGSMRMTRDQYEAAMKEIDLLMQIPDADRPLEQADRLCILAAAVEAYEREHFPIPEPTPEEAAAFRAAEEPKR